MRIYQAVPLHDRGISASYPFQYAAPAELMQVLEVGSYNDSAPTELQTRRELQTLFASICVHWRLISRRSEFQNLVRFVSSTCRCVPRQRGHSIRT
jgi:hypothetical protein